MELEYGHVKAYTQEMIDHSYQNVTSYLGGCLKNWTWYSTDKQVNDFDYAPLYSYFSNQDSVVVLQESPYYYGNEILARKYSKEEAGDDMNDILGDIIKVKPILAGGITLNANAVNQMVDFQYMNDAWGLSTNNTVQFDASVTPTQTSPLLTNQFVAVDNEYDYFPGIYNADPVIGLSSNEAWDYVRLQVPGERDEYGDYESFQTLYVGTSFYEKVVKN